MAKDTGVEGYRLQRVATTRKEIAYYWYHLARGPRIHVIR